MSISTPSSLSTVALSELVVSLPSEPHALELFRRAIVLRDNDAWEAIYHQYTPLVLTWITKHSYAKRLPYMDHSILINSVFYRFWHGFTPDKFAAIRDAASLFAYLKLCAYTEVMDTAYFQWRRAVEDSLSGMEDELEAPDCTEAAEQHMASQAIWQSLRDFAKTEQEWIVLVQSYLYDAKPSTILRTHPHIFSDIQAVHSTKRCVLERLRRHRDYFRESEQAS